MADFKTHITTSSIIGVGYAAVGFAVFDVPPAHALVAAALCSVAGMLPDLDSNSEFLNAKCYRLFRSLFRC